MTGLQARSLGGRLLAFAGAVLLVHLPFLLLSRVYAIERAQISVDLLLVTAVLAWRPVPGMVLLVLGWMVDGLVSQSVAFHFLSPAAFLDSARFAGDIRLTSFASWESAAALSLFAVCAALSGWLARRRRAEWIWTLAAIVLVGLLDVLNGSSGYAVSDRRPLPFNVAGSPAVTLSRQVAEARRHHVPVALDKGESVTGAVNVLDWVEQHTGAGVWLVVVESMGLPRDEDLRRRLAASVIPAGDASAYRLEQLQMPFKGATTSGELRALCQLAGSYAYISDAQAADCLPARLARMGLATTALHGFSGRMFDRTSWWPRVGFQRTLFLEDLGIVLPVCGGAFRGICDGALLVEASRRFSQPRQFVYTLTLNTHLPLDPIKVPADWQLACDQAHVSGGACELMSAQSALLMELAAIVARLPKPRPLVVVVGDHAPPFLNVRARYAFEPATVPAYVLRPL